MKLNLRTGPPILATLALVAWATSASGALVTDFRTYKASPATSLAGQGTGSPVVGDLSGNTAAAAFVIGYLDAPAVLGPHVGDTVTLTFGVSFDDATGMSNAGDNFRWALFDLNGEAEDSATGGVSSGPNYATAGTGNTNNFRGYILGHRGGGGAGANGSIRERISALATGDNAFAVTGGNAVTAPSLGAAGGDFVPLSSDVNGDNTGADYTGSLRITRTLTGVDITGSFSNGTLSNAFAASDASPASSTYGAIGFLIGGPLNVEQVRFQNIDVTAVPEPATWMLGLGSFIGGALVRRRGR